MKKQVKRKVKKVKKRIGMRVSPNTPPASYNNVPNFNTGNTYEIKKTPLVKKVKRVKKRLGMKVSPNTPPFISTLPRFNANKSPLVINYKTTKPLNLQKKIQKTLQNYLKFMENKVKYGKQKIKNKVLKKSQTEKYPRYSGSSVNLNEINWMKMHNSIQHQRAKEHLERQRKRSERKRIEEKMIESEKKKSTERRKIARRKIENELIQRAQSKSANRELAEINKKLKHLKSIF